MKLYDVSVPIREGMPVWPSDPGLKVHLASSMAKGDRANVTRLTMGAHTGTHMDAPFHFEPDGYGIDKIPLDVLIGPCRVFDMTAVKGHLGATAMSKCNFRGVTRALFKTKNSLRWSRGNSEFTKNFIAIVEDGAAMLVERGIKLVGVDYLSVEPYGSKEHPVHHTLMRANVTIIEGLNLSDVPAGSYELIALPIKLKGADGAPARVVLRAG